MVIFLIFVLGVEVWYRPRLDKDSERVYLWYGTSIRKYKIIFDISWIQRFLY